MITFEELIEATGTPRITDLDTSAFSPRDIVNIMLQRSEIIRDQRRPGKVVGAWVDNDEAPALALVDKMGDELARRAAAVIWLEYLELKPTLDAIAPTSVADIGCGYAIFDLFLWQDFPGQILLIDLERSDERHFGFRERGAAYSNLDVAKAFLTSNGVANSDIVCRNPETADLSDEPSVDLAVSFVSCGFHYPVELYMDFFEKGVASDGSVILDFRARKARPGVKLLKTLGNVTMVTDAAYGNARRVWLQKTNRQNIPENRSGRR